MDDPRRPRPSVYRPERFVPVAPPRVQAPISRPAVTTAPQPVPPKQKTITLNIPKIRIPNGVRRLWPKSIHKRIAIAVTIAVLMVTEIIPLLQPGLTNKAYALDSTASALLPKPSAAFAKKLNYDAKNGSYTFNRDFSITTAGISATGTPRITATAHDDASKGVEVTDPYTNASFSITPQFSTRVAKQDQNRLMYPLGDGTGWLVYSMLVDQVKEDIVLTHSPGDSMRYSYKLDVGDSLKAVLQKDGSVGIFGSELPINGNISTGSDGDAKLLQKMRKNAPKNKLLFSIPAPVVIESGRSASVVKSTYELKGDELTVVVQGLDNAQYPLTIDPSVFVKSAAKLMRGNNETNIDFNTDSDLIQKGTVTGARIADWITNPVGGNLPTNVWNHGTAVTGGFMYVVGGNNGTNDLSSVYWAPIAYGNAAGQNKTVTGWSTNSAYNLPQARSGLSLIAYNGYLFAIGGQNAGCTAANTNGSNGICYTVYSSKLGANGEPLPWTRLGDLSTPRAYMGVVAYENQMFMTGGQTYNPGLSAENRTEYANINPDGTLGAWTATTNLTSARYGHSMNVYNGYVYVLGGSNGAGTLLTTDRVQYAKITSTGIGSWVNTSLFATPRQSNGGTISTIWSGYMYVSGGCASINASGYCTAAPAGDIQLASINADGSLTAWTAMRSEANTANFISEPRLGMGLIAWRSNLYVVGGCSSQNATTGACNTTLATSKYGEINKDGNISTVFPSPSSDFFTGTSYLDNMPPAGSGAGQNGRIAMGVVINNGYLYLIGGCTTNTCSAMSNNVSYTQINADGSLASGFTTINYGTNAGPGGTNGLSAFGITVYNNTIYTVGGSNNGSYTAGAYRASLNPDGSVAATGWLFTNNVLPAVAAAPYVFSRANGTGTTGSLYIIGGCGGSAGIGCTTTQYRSSVQRCTIDGVGGAPQTAAACNTAAQLQLIEGLGIFGGAVYGDYIYLAGGATEANGGQSNTVKYAKINASGNITRTDGTTITGGWQVTSGTLPQTRRRTVAFAVNGYLYVIAGHDGAANQTLSDVVLGKINTETGDIVSLQRSAISITKRWDLRAATANGYIYLMGGCTDGNPPATCSTAGFNQGTNEYIQVYNNDSGSPALYSQTSVPTASATDRIGGSSVINNGYIYVSGGCVDIACSSATNAVEYAPINSNGSIGTWVSTASMGSPRTYHKMLAYNNRLYVVSGGRTLAANQAFETTEKTDIAANGSLINWTADTALGGNGSERVGLDAVIFNGVAYATGGNNRNGTYLNTISRSPIDPTTGTFTGWTETGNTAFTTARNGHVAVAYNSTLYILGGFDGTNYLLDVQYAKINNDGTIGAWKSTQSLPQPVRQGSGFAANGYLYVVGGRSTATACTNNTYVASIIANSTIANGNNPAGLNGWSQTNIKFAGARYGAAVAYDQGAVYVLGGGCAAMIAGADRAYYSSLQAQPQIAKFSYIIDADSDVFPLKTLFNGIDNGIGASWVLNYRSSTSAAATWGQNTVYGKTTLGTPQPYIPLDAAGVNTNFSRYHFIELTIDGSQAFGYPEDITRGPTITDLTLLFSADPSKRLRNGKTFIGGEQQPLDTPF